MTLSEFKAWLEGFEEAMGDKPPTAEQWRTIKEKPKKVQESVVQPRPTMYRNTPWYAV